MESHTTKLSRRLGNTIRWVHAGTNKPDIEGLLSLGFDRYGNEEDLVKDPIQHLYQVHNICGAAMCY